MTSVNAVPAPTLGVVTHPTSWRDVVIAAADALHSSGDAWAIRNGLTVRRDGLARVYRDPRLDTLGEVK